MDKKQEEWVLGTAVGVVRRANGAITVRLRGVVTAMVFEALHMRLAQEPESLARTLVVGDDALLAVTVFSAAEAATRGTPANAAGHMLSIAVPAWRRGWARDHCEFMRQLGISSRRVSLLCEEVPAVAGSWA